MWAYKNPKNLFIYLIFDFSSLNLDAEWPVNFPFHLIDRNLWYNGNPFNNSSPLNTSHVSNVVLSHTRGDFCHSYSSCVDVISRLQVSNHLQRSRQWWWKTLNWLQDQNISDIPFNFLIGGDGKTYEVRGWNYLSGFDLPNNNKSFSVGLIGDFTYSEPRKHQIDEVNALISESIRRRMLKPEYKILGMRESKRDGEKLFKQLETLDGWEGWIW